MTEDLLILGELIAEQAAHMDAAEHRLLANIRDFDKREGWASAQSCAHWLAWRVGWTLGTAREHVRVAKALGSLPHIDEALRTGKVSYCKVRAMTRVATPANERVILMDAELTTGSQLERACRKYRELRRHADGADPADDDRNRYVARRDLDNGMVEIKAVLHPDEAAQVWAALDQATKELLAARRAVTRQEPEQEREQDSNVDGRTGGALAPAEVAGCQHTRVRADVSAETCTADSATAVIDGSSAGRIECPDGSAETCAADLLTGEVDGHGGGLPDVSAGTCATRPPTRSRWLASCESELDSCDAEDESYATDSDSYEDECAFYERFGVIAEPRSRDRACVSTASRSTPRTNPRAETSLAPVPADVARAERSRPRPRFDRADGLVALARAYACGESARTPVEIVVTVTAAALQDGVAPAEERIAMIDGEMAVHGETARRLACDAGIVHMVVDAHGNPLSVGRRTRSISTPMWRALLKRDTCCRFPGCTNRLYLDGHHIEHWADGGETSLPNILLLCPRHHRFTHEYGYRIDVDADGTPHFFDAQGRPARDVPARIQRDDLGWPHLVAANRDLSIVPHTCGWDGEPVQYDEVARVLYLVDEGKLDPDDVC